MNHKSMLDSLKIVAYFMIPMEEGETLQHVLKYFPQLNPQTKWLRAQTLKLCLDQNPGLVT